MGDAIANRPYVTFADYLEAERDNEIKHEWIDGAIYAMSRGTPEHGRLTYRMATLVGATLAGDCEGYSSDTMLYIADVRVSTYADMFVVCGPLETVTVQKHGKSLGQGVTNPVLIVEVLSESTERYDREEKFAYYRNLKSLQEYVLVSQEERSIEVYRRPAAGGRWELQSARAGGVVTIHGKTIEVDGVYGSR